MDHVAIYRTQTRRRPWAKSLQSRAEARLRSMPTQTNYKSVCTAAFLNLGSDFSSSK